MSGNVEGLVGLFWMWSECLETWCYGEMLGVFVVCLIIHLSSKAQYRWDVFGLFY